MAARNWREWLNGCPKDYVGEWLNDFQTFKVSKAMAKLKTLKVA